MAERIDPAEFYKNDPDKDDFIPLEYIPDEELEEVNRKVKDERSEELGLGTPDKDLLNTMQAASTKIQGKASLPVTSLDYEKISEEQDSPSLNTVAPRDIGAVGFVPTAVKAVQEFTGANMFYQSGDEQVSGIMPEDNLWFDTDEAGQSMPEGTEFRFLGSGERDSPTNFESKKYGISSKTSDKKDIFGGTVRVPIPTASGELNLYINVEGTMEEINNNISTLRSKWREREGMDIPNPMFKSTPEIPLTFTDYGINIQAEANALNDVTGYPDNVVKMYLSRGAQKVVAPVYDILVDQGTNATTYLAFGSLAIGNFMVESGKTAGLRGEDYQRKADYIWATRKEITDFVPSSVEILKASIKKPTLKEYAEGQISFNEENLARFIEGKNASFVEKFFTDYAGGLAFTKVLDTVILPLAGRGPKAAQTFVAMIRGDLSMEKGKVGKELTKIFKNNSQLKTGKELFLEANKKAGKTEVELLKKWNTMPSPTKDKWATQAFNSFLKVRLSTKGGAISRTIKDLGNKSRFSTGVSLPAYAKNTKLGEKLASFGGLAGEEMFGPWGYLFGSIGLAGGGPFAMNTNWYARTKNNRVGSFALASVEFGDGFASGFDALAFAFTNRRPITSSQFKNASDVLRKEGLPAALIEEEVFRRFAIQNPNKKQAALGNFMIMDKDGNERMAGPSDPEWKKLNEIVLDINKIVDPIQKARITTTLQTFLDIQNSFADQIQDTAERWLKDNPGASLTDHPLNKLGASLYEVLDLITTRSAAESMTEGANYGFRKGIDLKNVELAFQQRKDQLLAIGEYMSDATTFMSKYNVAEENMVLLEGLDKFIQGENTYVDAVSAELSSLPAVFSKMYNTSSFDSAGKLTDETQFVQDYFNSDVTYQLFRNDFNKVKDSIVKLEIENRRTVYNILNHMKHDIAAHTPKGRVQVYNGLIGVANKDIATEARLVYAPFLQAAANNKVKVSGQEVDELFLNINSILDTTAESRLAKEVLPVGEANTLEDVFSSALKQNGDAVREALKNTFEDLNLAQIADQLGIDVDLADDVGMYQYFLKNKSKIAESDNVFLKAVQQQFGNLQLDAVTITSMDRVIRAERSMLLGKLNRGMPLTTDEQGFLNQYYKIIGKGEDEFGTLGSVIKKNMGVEVFEMYKISSKIYATAIGPRRWGTFNRLFEKIERVNKQIDEAGEGFDKGTGNVYTMEESVQMETLGQMLITNPEYGVRILTEKLGSLASVNGKQTFAISNAQQADAFRVISRMAINAHLEKKFKGKMQILVQKYGKDGIKNKDITGELAEEFKALGQGGEINSAFEEIAKYSKVIKGTQVWTGEIKDGDLVFSTDIAWTTGPDNKILSSLEDQYGTSIILNDQSVDDLFFGKDIDLMIKNDKSIKIRLESIENKMRNVDINIKKDVQKKTTAIQRNNRVLVDYFSQNIGLEIAPEGVGGAFNIDTAVNSMISDGTGRKMDGFIDYLENLKDSNTGSYVIKGSLKQRKEAVRNYVENLVHYQFANDILVESGLQRSVKNSQTGNYDMVPSYVPDITLINKAKEKYLPILEKFMSPEQANKYIKIAELGAITSSVGTLGSKAGISSTMTNIPSRMSISGYLSRGMNMARHVVSPQWVGVDAIVRRARLSSAGVLKTILLAPSTVTHRGNTVIDAVHDMLVNGNYSVKNAVVLERLLPEAIYQANVQVTGFVTFFEEEGGTPILPTPFPLLKKSTRYDPRPELGDSPLIAREKTSRESQLLSRINEEFGNFPKFIKAVQEGDRRANEYSTAIGYMREDSSIRNQMEQLLN